MYVVLLLSPMSFTILCLKVPAASKGAPLTDQNYPSSLK